jgi:cytochrome c oxidase assembly factor CtaG
VSSSLPAPSAATLLTQWTVEPLVIALSIAAAFWYLRTARRARAAGHKWSAGRTTTFLLGVALLIWTTCGFLGVYADSLYWVWTARALSIWLVVPAVLLAGRPLHLVGLVSKDGLGRRLLRTPPARFLGHPLIAPGIVPVLSAMLFFGPVPAWTLQAPAFGWALDIVLLTLGTVALVPMLGPDEKTRGLAAGAALAVGMIELILDAIPGIALRLQTHLVTSYFDHVQMHSWSPAHLRDQQIAGATLWVVAEVLDLPFLVLAFNRWLRADARDAAEIDAVLQAERDARAALPRTTTSTPAVEQAAGLGEADAPWWLKDDDMRRRLSGQ